MADNYPFRLYGDDTSDWYEGEHQFEVQLERVPTAEERERFAALWVAGAPRTAGGWLWSDRFFTMGIRARGYPGSLAMAKRILSEVHRIVPVIDVSCWGTRSNSGAWTEWSRRQQSRPDPGPTYDFDLARDILFWPREVDPSLPVAAKDPAFDEQLATLRADKKLTVLQDTVAAKEGLELITTVADPLVPTFPPEIAGRFDDGDQPLRAEIPVAMRSGSRKVSYLWQDELHQIDAQGIGGVVVDVDHGRLWFLLGHAVCEVTLGTNEYREVWRRESNDYSFWGITTVGSGPDRMLVVTTASRIVGFQIGPDGLRESCSKKRKYASPVAVFGGRALVVTGDAGVAFFIPAAGALTQVLTLPKVQTWVSAAEPERVVLGLGPVRFELVGIDEMIAAKEAARDKKRDRANKKKATGKGSKSSKGALVLAPCDEPPHIPLEGLPSLSFEQPYRNESGAVYIEGKPHSAQFAVGHLSPTGEARSLLEGDKFRAVGVSPSGDSVQAVTWGEVHTVHIPSGRMGSAKSSAAEAVGVAAGERECVVACADQLLWFSLEAGAPELVAVGQPTGRIGPCTPLLVEDIGALLLPRGDRGLELYVRTGARIDRLALVKIPTDSVVQRAEGAYTAHHTGNSTSFQVEGLAGAVESGRTKLAKRAKRKPLLFPRARPDWVSADGPRKSDLPNARHSFWREDGAEITFGGDVNDRGSKPWLKVRMPGGEARPVPGFETTWGNAKDVAFLPDGSALIAGGPGVFRFVVDSAEPGDWLEGIDSSGGVASLGPGLLAVLQYKVTGIYRLDPKTDAYQLVVSRKTKPHGTVQALPESGIFALIDLRKTTILRFVDGDKPKIQPVAEVELNGVMVGRGEQIFVYDRFTPDSFFELLDARRAA